MVPDSSLIEAPAQQRASGLAEQNFVVGKPGPFLGREPGAKLYV